ncbi:unnamed protein product [Owenia fusiformis]|uniref:Peroxidase n=1 Tax=Owenia fusiformis TaxID=6347 RepID=A0A8S4NHD8_OWEFU|nr:unnamed protein product [Owenia fusiformis]
MFNRTLAVLIGVLVGVFILIGGVILGLFVSGILRGTGFLTNEMNATTSAPTTTTATPTDPSKWWLETPPKDAIALALYQQHIQSNNIISSYSQDEVPSNPAVCGDPRLAARTFNCTNNRARTIDGTCNDLDNPGVGSRSTRFNRNVPLNETAAENETLQATPNPRLVSEKLLQRKEFIPAPSINLFVAAWIQFMIHDWFDHGTNDKTRNIRVKVSEDDPLGNSENEIIVDRTRKNDCNTSKSTDTMFQNDVTHWWDASQMYGSDANRNKEIRSFKDGKLILAENGRLPLEPSSGLPITGFNKNWWVGLTLMHVVWTKEHNAVCDMLLGNHPDWSDEQLFSTARLIISATIARIHTLEWTSAILANRVVKLALKSNWYGVSLIESTNGNKAVADYLAGLYPMLSQGIPGAIGNPKDTRGVPFALSEEFVAVYRLHPLVPDNIEIRRHTNGTLASRYNLPEVMFNKSEEVLDNNDIRDVLFTFGNAYSGAMKLHNYPNFLRNLQMPEGGPSIDLGMIDLVRDRERGIARYNKFRRLMNLPPVKTFEELNPDPAIVAALKEVYDNDIDMVDLLVGGLAESDVPDGFGFSDTIFRIFAVAARRRLETDRFFTDDYTEEFYTKEGLEWVDKTFFGDVLARHYPELAPHLANSDNAFAPWGNTF